MAKKKSKEGLIITGSADLFAGFAFENGSQVSLIDDDPDPIQSVDPTVLELEAALSKYEDTPSAVPSSESEEVDLNVLFADVTPSIPEVEVAAVPAEEEATPEPVQMVASPLGPMKVWREAEYVNEVATVEAAVVLQKIGSKAVAIIPHTLEVAAQLHAYLTLDKLGSAHLNPDVPVHLQPGFQIQVKATDGRIHFPMTSILTSEDVDDSVLVKHLQNLGLGVIISPSLRGWVKKEFRRRKRENTPFDLPMIQDDRPMYDRMEVGLIVKCIEDVGLFKSGIEYVVVETDGGQEEEDGSSKEKSEKGAVGLKRRGVDNSKTLYFGELDGDMASFFSLETDGQKAFDPESVFTKVYPELVHQAMCKVKKLGHKVFDYIGTDTAQAVHYKHLVFTHPPRQGKTSAIFEYAEVAGSKRCGLVTVSDGVDVFEQEAKRLGIKDYVVVKKLADFQKKAKYFLMSYSWLKSTGRRKDKSEKDRLSAGNKCPHCESALVRPKRSIARDESGEALIDQQGKPILKIEYKIEDGKTKVVWTDSFGYMCRNKSCSFKAGTNNEKLKGAAWYKGNRNPELTGYIDTQLAQHARCIDQKLDTFHQNSRQCNSCGYVHRTYQPARYRRVKKFFNLLAVDEVHNIKNADTDQARAILGMMHAKRRVGATGTLMPNTPSDAFHPLGWTFGYGTHLFKYQRGVAGVHAFNDDYTESILVESENSSYTKKVPFIKKPIQFWNWKSSKCLFRAYSDPYVIESMAKAGLKIPKFKPVPVELVPGVKQGLLLVSTIAQFDNLFKEYSDELKSKAKKNEKTYLLNSSQVLARMTQMKLAATCPGALNERFLAAGKGSVYDGVYGGCKIEHVKNLVADKVEKGGKVVIFSDMVAMREALAKELVYYNPVVFNVGWNREKRSEAFKRFRENPNHHVFMCGPRSVKESVDLSVADTVISTDILYSPGIQTQAWSRVLTPRPYDREVECHILLTKYSIDSHIYGTFYGKIAAAEQALYGRQLTKADKALDIQYFVDQVIAEKANIMQWLVEAGEDNMAYMPVLKTLQQLQSYDAAA